MSDDADLTVTVLARHAEALRSAVATGEYPTFEAALAAALDTWAGREEQRADDFLWIKAKVRASLADPDPDLSMDEVEQRLKRMFEHDNRRADEAA